MTHESLTILNADDNEVGRYAKNRTLRHAGFDVIDAHTGAEVLEILQTRRPPLVMLDVKLPDMSGIDVCKIIKKRWPATIVLQTSATFVTSADRTRGLEGGADTYLIEPIDPDELVATVRALVRLQAAEETTRLLNATLERKINERTRELHRANIKLVEQIAQRERAEASLLQAQKMEAVGQLTGAMVHDFNNILASMTGYIHLVRRLTDSDELRGMLDSALAAADRGKRLTARLLAFARSEDMPTSTVDVTALVNGMTEWMRQTLGKGIGLEVNLRADERCLADSDANQLELAVLNLVLNARDAMPAGGKVTIDVAQRQVDHADGDLAPGSYVVLTVTDTGSGMPPEVVARAFDAFFTTKPRGRGTGLGLAQVANVVNRSRGVARIHSVEGEGTRVELWLGVAQHELVVPPEAFVQSTGAAGERVLVVDDEHDILNTLARLLERTGYVVETVSTGADALAAVARRTPDLLLIDYAMPGMSGLDVVRTVRARHPDIGVLFMSGFADTNAIHTEMPATRLLRKPFGHDELLATLRTVLDARAAHARPRAQAPDSRLQTDRS